MEADKPFVPPWEPPTEAPATAQSTASISGPDAALMPEDVRLGLDPDTAPMASPGARHSLLNALKVGAVLALGGWFIFLYFSNDNNPVRDYKLSAVLPGRVDGWKSGFSHQSNPSSVSIGPFEKFTSSSVRRTYTQGDKEIALEIWDWAGDYPYHMPIDIPGWANGEEVRVGAEQGHLRYHAESRTGRLRVRYLDRFYVIVEGKGIERHELEAWYRRINLVDLRRELDQLHGESASR
jgi:hypothetical protein